MDFIYILKFVLLIICSYFVGNISFARIFSKLKKGDITKSGSGNPGSMNMLRTYGFGMGILTLLCDAIKGAIPALVGLLLFKGYGAADGTIALYSAGIAAILGHNYPVLYKFKGGKGIACSMGVFLVADPMWLGIFFVVAFIYLWIFDYGSLASLTVISALIIIEGLKNYGNLIISILLMTIYILVLVAHRSNIRKLLVGKENKANLQKSIKKHFNKQKSVAKTEYKQEKTELLEKKTEIDKLKEDDKKKYRQERAKLLKEKRKIKSEYRSKKRKSYDYASILTAIASQDETASQDNE